MELLPVVLFFTYMYGLGSLVGLFAKQSEDFFERQFMRLGLGLPAFIFLAALLNLLRIPVDYRIFLGASILGIVLSLVVGRGRFALPKIGLTKTMLFSAAVLILFSASLYMYEKGAFAYPWLEDDDSWTHAVSVKYVSVEKTLYMTPDYGFQYMDPYPPGYAAVMGVLHQTSSSIMWTLKFFNALIISLSIPFFYYFAKSFFQSREKGLIAAFVLAAVPGYLSHFIWALSLIMPLFFISLYCLEKMKEDRSWFWLAGLSVAGVLMTQPSHAVKFAGFMGIYFVAKLLSDRALAKYVFLAGIVGIVLSLPWWGSMIAIHKLSGIDSIFGLKTFTTHTGSATRPYTIDDYLLITEVPDAALGKRHALQTSNMINNPVGLGIPVVVLLMVSLFVLIISYQKMLSAEGSSMLISFLWAIYSFMGVSSIPLAFFAFRFWMLLSFAVALVCAIGLWALLGSGKKEPFTGFLIVLCMLAVPVSLIGFSYGLFLAAIATIVGGAAIWLFVLKRLPDGTANLVILLFVIGGILATSAYQKYAVNTALWGPGARFAYGQAGYDEVMGFVSLQAMPPGTRIFTFGDESLVIGVDQWVCPWCRDEFDFREQGLINQSAMDIHSWLVEKNYRYLAVGSKEVRTYGVNETRDALGNLSQSGLFMLDRQRGPFILFRVL